MRVVYLSSQFLGGEAGRPGGQRHPRLCNKFEASVGYLRPESPVLKIDLTTTTTRIGVLWAQETWGSLNFGFQKHSRLSASSIIQLFV